MLARDTLLGLGLADDLGAVSKKERHFIEKLLLLLVRKLGRRFETGRMVILGPSKIDYTGANLHPVKHA